MNSYEMQEALAEARADFAAKLAEERALNWERLKPPGGPAG